MYGVGDTKEAAEVDARQWLDDDTGAIVDYIPSQAADGDVCMMECTPALMVAVQELGGDVAFDTSNDGVACLPDEIKGLLE